MTPLDPILHEHEKRMAMHEAIRRSMQELLMAMEERDRTVAPKIKACRQWLAQGAQRNEAAERQHQEWWAHHRLAMKQFDEKLNGLIAWLNDAQRPAHSEE